MQSINLDGFPRPVVVTAGMDEYTLRDGHVITREFYRVHASEADACEYARLVASGDTAGAEAYILEIVNDHRLTPEQRLIAGRNSEKLGGDDA